MHNRASFRHITVLSAALLLSACAASVKSNNQAAVKPNSPVSTVKLVISASPEIEKSPDWQTFRAEWRTAFSAAAEAHRMQSAYAEVMPQAEPAGTVLVHVKVNDYRYLTPGARYGLGVMTGNAYIDAKTDFYEFPAGKLIGSQQYTTSSSAWQGVFAPMTDKQVRALSEAMIAELDAK